MKMPSKFKFLLCLIATVVVVCLPKLARSDEQPQRVTVSGKEMAQRLKTKVAPVYSEEARKNKVEGVVKLQVLVATDGTIHQLQVIAGHPLVVRSALDAVRHWTYNL